MAKTIVLKFGGTSVADANVIARVRDIVEQTDAERKAVVVSAMGGITDLLIQAAEQAASKNEKYKSCLLYTSPSPRDGLLSRMPSSA